MKNTNNSQQQQLQGRFSFEKKLEKALITWCVMQQWISSWISGNIELKTIAIRGESIEKDDCRMLNIALLYSSCHVLRNCTRSSDGVVGCDCN